MQLLTAQCPYCGRDVETTLDRTAEPIVCPKCRKPFEMDIPTVVVKSVREVEGRETAGDIAVEPEERTLIKVHPAVFRARPLSSLIVVLIAAAACYGLWLTLTIDDSATDIEVLGSTAVVSTAWILWLSAAALALVSVLLAYWFVLSLTKTLIVTDSRTILQEGIISRDSSEVQHDDVRNIQLEQSLSERLLGIGEIGISSSGQDDLEIVAAGMASPGSIVKTIRENQS